MSQTDVAHEPAVSPFCGRKGTAEAHLVLVGLTPDKLSEGTSQGTHVKS